MRKLTVVAVLLMLSGSATASGQGKGAAPRLKRPAALKLAQASAAARCTVTEILATNDKKGTDPKLEKLKGKLAKPPFSAWDTFVLLGDQELRAEKSKPVAAKLQTGGALNLVYKDKLVSQGGKPRLRLGIDMDDKAGKRTVSTVVVFDSGDSLLFAGEPFKKGTYILALTCMGL